MPCPHNEITIVQRSQRQSAVAAAAYQSGEKLFCMIAKNLAKSADGDIPAGEQMAYASYITGMETHHKNRPKNILYYLQNLW